MRRTIQQQIAANRRASLFYAFGLIVILVLLGAGIVAFYAPKYWPLGMAGAGVLGIIVALIARYSGPSIMLAISGAREATHEEDQVLSNVVEEMALAAGIPAPTAYVMDTFAPNAFATGMDPKHGIIVVTTGLLAKLDRDELQGVVAHEMGHIRNEDVRFMTTVGMIAGLIPMLADWLRLSFWFGGGGDRDSDSDSAGNIFAIVGIVLAFLGPIFAVLLQLAVSRQREYLADATAAELTRYPQGLANALIKISDDPTPIRRLNRATQHMFIVNPLSSSSIENMLSTHPNTAERVRRLLEIAGPTAAAAFQANETV